MPQLAARLEAPLANPPPLRKLIGPSFILLGLGLGSGELLLWPYLSANFGLGLIWGALVGITIQLILNLEIERYTLATGESVFVGLARTYPRIAPLWFLLSTLIPWLWPGIISTAALIVSQAILPQAHPLLTIVLLLGVGGILTGRASVYQTLEKWQKLSIGLAVPFFLVLTFYLAKDSDWVALWRGLQGIGEGFLFLPPNLPLFTFLGALAYAGAGGNLNLAQSFYIKDKGFGMGAHANCSTSQVRGHHPLTAKPRLEGYTFPLTQTHITRFKRWWRVMSIEHTLVFWLTGLISMLLLATLAYITVHQQSGTIPQGVQFLFLETQSITSLTHPLIGIVFLGVVAWMLFSTQLSITDSTSRILAENSVLFHKQLFPAAQLARWYKTAVWVQVGLGCAVMGLGIREPFLLVTISASLNAVAMLVYTVLLWQLNRSQLPRQIQPSKLRQIMLLCIALFFTFFSSLSLWRWLQ